MVELDPGRPMGWDPMGTESWLALAFGAAFALAFDLAFPLAFALAFHDVTMRGWNIQ